MSVSVCLSVCLSVREHFSGTTCPIFTEFLCVLPPKVSHSSTGGVQIRYVLPVLCDGVAASDVIASSCTG